MKELCIIQNEDPRLQLELFLLALKEKKVPVIVPQSVDVSALSDVIVPEEADLAVSSSGTTGKPKLYFRRLGSWKDFFPEQNRVSGMTSDARIFVNGSMAYTGNLNTAVCAYYSNQYLYISKEARPRNWVKEIRENRINTIYMIPDKLFYLLKTEEVFPEIKKVLLCSQPVSKQLYDSMKKAFPNADIILYYGATETNFISYKYLNDQNADDANCMGNIFNYVNVKITDENHICIKSSFCVYGIEGYYDTKDLGYIKDGLLYLNGRADDVINIHGQKINKSEIEKCLLSVPGIEEASVTAEEINSIVSVVAHIAGKNLPEKVDVGFFNGIPSVYIPKKYICYEKLPRNESGKICLQKQI